ncbi:MAG: hypothetical protein ABSF84_15890 [Acidimicrobiales bacterium]
MGLVIFVAVPGVQPGAGAAANPLAGSQGTVTSLPSTASAVTVSGQGAYAGLQVTVNQTQDLTNQAISVSWSGGTPTQSSGDFQSNYLQIFECWGDPQTTDPPETTDPGPLPTQCQFGAETVSSSAYPVSQPGFEYSRVLSQPSWSSYSTYTGAGIGWKDTSTGYLVEPFQAVDGTTIDQQANYNYDANPLDPSSFWLNPYFRFGTSNEVDFARTYANGSGQQLFQVQTGLEAPGLGCGQDLQPVAGGGDTTPQCWLVVVPRGTPDQENPSNVDDESVVTSPLTPEAWANRIAIPLGFNPVGSSCSINADANQIMGGELATSAVASWEPALCGQPGSPAFSYIENSDDQARQNIVDPTYGSAGMSVFSTPADPSEVDPGNPVVYAPLTLSGVVVAFNIQRVPAVVDGEPQPDEAALAGTQVGNIYLTPRLMAKLLTQSYQGELEGVSSTGNPSYKWVKRNPVSILDDPDFLQYNPEFTLLSTTQAIDAATVLVDEASSDAATVMWKWIMSDPEAAAWMAGKPDPWGMVVNPLYDTTAAKNPTGVSFGVPALENYPKNDPWCISTGDVVTGPPSEPARPLCVLDWSPYSLSMSAAAASTGVANDGAKTTFNPAGTANTAWTANGPQEPGTHFIISITDSASAAQYGLQTASLSPAGDDPSNPSQRVFVGPDSASLLAGEQAMVPSDVPGVVVPDPSSTAADAYPLTMLTYAATTPESLTPAERKTYSTFLLYAIGDGQTSGVEPGQLPAGYVPLPGALRLESLQAVDSILNPPAEPSATTPVSSTPSASYTDTGSAIGSSTIPDTEPTGGTGTTTAAATPTTSVTPKATAPVLSAVRTSWLSVGEIRWVLPLVLLIGLCAALGALLLGRTGRSVATAAGPTTEPDGEVPT